MPRYKPLGKAAFAVVIEMLEIIGFVIGFYAVVALPAKNMESDLTHIKKGSTWRESVQFVQDELKILVESFIYLLSSLDYLFGTGADWIVLWVTHAYAHEHII